MAKIMISLPQEFLKKVDRAAKAQGRSRSELIREALRTLLAGSQEGRRSWTEALAPLKELEQQWVGQWNSKGDSRVARERLREALRTNRHVPQFLAGESEWAGPEPASYAPGSREEAVICDAELGEAWRATPDAMRWLGAHAPRRKSGKRRKR